MNDRVPTSSPKNAKFSVIIPTYCRADKLELCLESVSRQEYSDFDVIVVDNSRGDPATRLAAERWGARYVLEDRQGLCRARNRGALVSAADVLAYLDDDAMPEPGWLAAFAEAFLDDRVMGVAGRTVPLSLESDAEKLYASVRGAAYNRAEPLVVDANTPDWFAIAGFGGIGPGCNMALRRKAFEVWPGFHEGTDRGTAVYGGGEQHAFFSLVDRGFAVAYTPFAVVRHPFPATMEALRSRYLRDLTASTAYFTMMLVEEGKHRGKTARYLLESIAGRQRSWRGTPIAGPKVVGSHERLGAILLGPLRYVQGLFQSSRRPLKAQR